MPPQLSALSHPWLGTWSRPPDRPSQVALVAAMVLFTIALIPGGPDWAGSWLDYFGIGELKRRRRFLAVSSLVAAFLSLGYVAFYLRGGPRAASAATYWLQGRALSHGHLVWTAPDPTASFRAENLVVLAPNHLSGLLPPGFPSLLASMFLLGAPMLIGPLLAATLVVATWFLTRELGASVGLDAARTEQVSRIAVAFSILSATLRYHTADALPHGAAAAALTLAFATALKARRENRVALFAFAGIALGLLVATQPWSAVAVTVGVVALALGGVGRGRALLWTCAGALPGILLFVAANRAATGHALGSIGTLHAAGGKAFAIAAAQQLRANLVDVANFEPIALLPLLLLAGGTRRRGGKVGLTVAVVLLELLVIACFARVDATSDTSAHLLVDVLPLEHALLALSMGLAFPKRLAKITVAIIALSLGGFAVHASYDHERIASADLGRPHYEPDVPREAGITHGLLFLEDDEGFELADDPDTLASHGLEVARLRNDDHDRLVYDLLGHPPTHRYSIGPKGPVATPWSPAGGNGDTWRFEAESDDPPVAQPGSAGRADVVEERGSCASNGHALALEAYGFSPASVTIELPIPRPSPAHRSWLVTPRTFQRGGTGTGELTLVASLGGPPLAQWSLTDEAQGRPVCLDLPGKVVDLGTEGTRVWLVLTARGGSVALDKTTLRGR